MANNASTMTYLEMKEAVAAIVGAVDSPDEVHAGRCIHRAIDWIDAHDWEQNIVTGITFVTVAGQATYSLPAGPYFFRKMHNIRTSTSPERKLYYVRKEQYDDLVIRQGTNRMPLWYSTYTVGGSSKLILLPTPESVEGITYDYYRLTPKPTAEGSVLTDFPTEWEDMLITRAQYYCALMRGVRSERLHMLRQDSEHAMRNALMRDTNEHDEDIAITPGDVAYDNYPYDGYDNPNRWW